MDQTNYQEKYHLYCKASCGMPYNALPPMYRRMRQILTEELPQLLAEQPPANDLAIYDSFRRDLELLKYYCHFPSLFSKNVVALGGRFSSGKSTFINRLLGDKQLSADVNPTTSVPTYLLKGEENIIYAQNFLERVVALNETEFASLVHDEDNEFGSSISRLFTSVYIEQENFKWDNLAILDTPGYSKPDNEEEIVTDKNIAKSQLNSADYILWLISAEDGTITEEDLQFLASLYPHIPKLILLNKADKKSEEDIVDIVALIKRTLQQRNIQYEDVIPVSARPRSPFTTDVIAEKLDQWNDESGYHPLALDFKKHWLAINQYYQAQLTQAQTRVSDLNRIVMLADNDEQAAELEALKANFFQKQENLRQLQLELREVQVEFFQQLNLLGESLGIELKEPTDLEVMQLNPSHNFMSELSAVCKKLNIRPQDAKVYLPKLTKASDSIPLQQLIRKDSGQFIPLLESLSIQQKDADIPTILRNNSPKQASKLTAILQSLNIQANETHIPTLLRKDDPDILAKLNQNLNTTN